MKLDKIKEKLQSILLTFNRISTNKGVLQYDGDELVEGISVRLFNTETEEESTPEDGEYYLGEEDGRTIVVESGKISKIIEPGEEPEAVEETVEENMSVKQERFNKVKELYEESYEEKERKIIEAIRSLGFDCWLIEAGEDYAVVESWNDEAGDYKHLRFQISWDGEGNAVVGEFDEVKPAFVPVSEDVPATVEEQEMSEEKPEESEEEKPQEEVEMSEEQPQEEEVNVDELKLKVEQFSKENEELKAKLAELEKPAEAPANEQFKKVNKIVSTGNDKLDNLMRYCK